jgi:dihydrodipicolinate reductase
MSIPVVVIGALGRMGSTIVNLVRQDATFALAGALVLESQLSEAAALGCPVESDLATLLDQLGSVTIIDFTCPETSLTVAGAAGKYKCRHVIGTTGFTEDQKIALGKLAQEAPLFWSPNMSVGVNVLLKVLPELTRLLGEQYDVEMMEAHHNKKRDSPSGTAIRLAECLAGAKNWALSDTACYHREGMIGERPNKELGVQTLRGGDVVGDHTIFFFGPGERIEVKHQAHSRENFGKGALRAAAWLQNKPAGKLFTMQDMLQ